MIKDNDPKNINATLESKNDKKQYIDVKPGSYLRLIIASHRLSDFFIASNIKSY